MHDSLTIEYVVVGVYLVLMIGVGFVVRSFNKDVSDYFRNGCKATWWMVGASAFMTAFSAWTFTGAAGVAYVGGWTVMAIFLANVLGFVLEAILLAPWFRQLRAITAPEVIRLRFGPVTQQFYAWIGVVMGLLYAAIWLYGLAIFSAAVFGFDIRVIIIALGLAVLISSVTGGAWAVMASDVLQSLLLMPLTLLVAILCLDAVGGVNGLFTLIEQRGLSDDMAFVAEPGRFTGANDYTWWWIAAVLLYKVVGFGTLTSAPKYFGVKDGREARWAAWLAAAMMALGALVWFIPPVVARLLWEADVDAVAIAKPAEASYAIASMKLLPAGMTGLMAVAMFAATMSSMDTGLNRNAAVFTRDIYPALCRLVGAKPAEGTRLLRLGELFSLVFGVLIVLITLYFAQAQGEGVFEHMMNIGAMLALPMAIPMLLALFIRRVPSWAAMVSVLAALVPSAWSFLSDDWKYQTTVFTNLAVGAAAFVLTMPFWRVTTTAYRHQVQEFFTRMHTPIDFEREVGEATDRSQLRVVGAFALAQGAFVCLLALLPNPMSGRLMILAVGGSVVLCGAALWLAGRGMRRRSPASAAAKPAASLPS